MSENESMRNASMKEGIMLWARACLNLIGLVGRQGVRYGMYLWVSHVSSIKKSWGRGSSVAVSLELWCCWYWFQNQWMHVVENLWWVKPMDVWRRAMGKEMWRVDVVVFISMSRLHLCLVQVDIEDMY